MDIAPYKLADSAFWASSHRGADRLATQLVGKYQGLLLDAPQRIDVKRRSTFPAAVYQLGKIRQVAALRFKTAGVMTAMNVTENRLYVVSAGTFDKDDDAIVAPSPDPAKLPEGDMSTTESLELRAAMAMPWQSGRYLLTALLHDQVSNRAAVELLAAAPPVATARGALAVWPPAGEPLPSYRRHADSLPLPTHAGLVLAANGEILRGAFRLPPGPAASLSATSAPTAEKPQCVVAVWLLLLGAQGGHYVFPLVLPSFEKTDDTCTGQFSLDLRRMPNGPRTAGSYFIYAFSGVNLVGPIATTLNGG